LIKLKDLENFTMGMNHRNDDVNQRGMVCPRGSRSIVALTINHYIVEKDCIAIKWDALRYDRAVRTMMNWSERKMIADGGCG
jgi:hypothetical protein